MDGPHSKRDYDIITHKPKPLVFQRTSSASAFRIQNRPSTLLNNFPSYKLESQKNMSSRPNTQQVGERNRLKQVETDGYHTKGESGNLNQEVRSKANNDLLRCSSLAQLRPSTMGAERKLRANFKNQESEKVHPESIEMSKNFDRQLETKTLWNERNLSGEDRYTMFNCSSVGYDFVTGKKKHQKSATQLKDCPQIANRKKVIAEVYDIIRPFAPKYHPEYQALMKQDIQCFHKVKGGMTSLLDRSHRSGQLHKPFKRFRSVKNGLLNN